MFLSLCDENVTRNFLELILGYVDGCILVKSFTWHAKTIIRIDKFKIVITLIMNQESDGCPAASSLMTTIGIQRKYFNLY